MHITLTQQYKNGEERPIILNSNAITSVKGHYITYKRTDREDEFIYVLESIETIAKLLESKSASNIKSNNTISYSSTPDKRVINHTGHGKIPPYFQASKEVIDLDTRKRYNSIGEAARAVGVSQSGLSKYLKYGNAKNNYCGRHFAYASDMNISEEGIKAPTPNNGARKNLSKRFDGEQVYVIDDNHNIVTGSEAEIVAHGNSYGYYVYSNNTVYNEYAYLNRFSYCGTNGTRIRFRVNPRMSVKVLKMNYWDTITNVNELKNF